MPENERNPENEQKSESESDSQSGSESEPQSECDSTNGDGSENEEEPEAQQRPEDEQPGESDQYPESFDEVDDVQEAERDSGEYSGSNPDIRWQEFDDQVDGKTMLAGNQFELALATTIPAEIAQNNLHGHQVSRCSISARGAV